jgi:acyl carrier protein
MIDRSDIEQDLCQFIRAHSLSEQAITTDMDLLSSGLLDSMLVIDLVAHVEAKHGISIADREITPEHFRGIAPLADLIAAKRAAAT